MTLRTLWHDVGRDTRWVLISYSLWGVGEGLWMYLQPLYLASLGATPQETGFALGMWGLGRFLFIMPFGVLADRVGPRRMLLPGWYAGVFGVLILAAAPDWHWAAPGFLLYGVSAAAIPVTHLYIMQAVHHDPSRRADLPPQASLTLLWAAYSAGLVITPTLGGWMGDTVGLRAVFLFSAIWFGLSAAAILRTSDYPIPERPAQGYAYRALVRQPIILATFGLITLAFIAIAIGQTLSPQYLEDARGFSTRWIGTFGSFNALGTVVFSLALARFAPWRGFFASLGMVMVSFAMLLASGAWPLVIVAYFLLGAYNTARPLAVGVVSNRVAEHQRGMAYALLDTLAGLAILVGTNTGGRLYASNPDWPLLTGAISLSVIILVGVAMLRRRSVKRVRRWWPVSNKVPAEGMIENRD